MEPKKISSLPPEFLRDLLHLVATAVLVLDEAGQITFANRYACELLKSDRLEGRSLKDFLSMEDQNILFQNMLYLTRKEGFYEGEVLLYPAYGDPFVAHISLNSFSFRGRNFLIVTCQNISEFKRLERSFREAKHLVFLGQMLSDMAHQVRNPILVIGGLAKRLRQNPSKLSSYASAIFYQCERLEKLLKALEEFVYLPRPRFDLVSIREVLTCLSRKFRLELLGDNPELRFEPVSVVEGVHFYTDLYLLVRALSQVVQNALEAHQEKGINDPVELKVWSSQDRVFFEVRDWGDGFSQETLPYLFNPFFSTKPGHLGMGLTLANRIVEELDGLCEIINLKDPTVLRVSFPLDRRRPERKRLLS